MCRCPFHSDKTPSMKLNETYYYCFGCHLVGDVIDFTGRLFSLSPLEAAQKLISALIHTHLLRLHLLFLVLQLNPR